MKIVLTGATGFIGKPLVTRLLSAGHEVTALVRDPAGASGLSCKKAQWEAGATPTDPKIFAGTDTLIHLAGSPVGESRWSDDVKRKIRDSRILGTKSLVDAIGKLDPEMRPKQLISASAVGFYGDRGEEILTERSQRGSGFLADVVSEWENEVSRADSLGVRSVMMRFGVVLGRGGGALAKMQPVPLGNGKQWMSWIHRDDLIAMIEFATSRAELRGPLNATAPEPVRNAEFSRELARAKRWPGALPFGIPAGALRIMLGEMSSMILASQRVLPEAALQAGFKYSFGSLHDALGEIYR